MDLLAKLLKRDEGLRLEPYRDSEGFWTIGYGHLIDRRKGGMLPRWVKPSFPISPEEASELLNYDVSLVRVDLLAKLPWYNVLDEVRRVVLGAMCFQMGITGLMGFRRTLAAAEAQEWKAAAGFMLESKWAKQSTLRAVRLANAMETGLESAFNLPLDE